MKLKQEHARNFTPVVRAGIFFLTLKGEVVYVGESSNILREVAIIHDHDKISFDGFSYIIGTDSDREYLTEEFRKIYLPK